MEKISPGDIETWAAELIAANKELAYQNEEKEKRAAELIIANNELAFQNKEKEKRAAELVIANKELKFQNKEKGKRAAELVIANKELAFQNREKEKRAAELIIANEELIIQNKEKEKRAAELVVANKELKFQNKEKGKRAAELVIANKELAFQNREKEKRAAELIIANEELAFQNEEKENRAAELIIANKELIIQNKEKEKKATELATANRLYAFNSAINQTLVHSKDEQTVFKQACRIAIDVGKFKVAWIGILDADNRKINLVESCNILPEDLPIFLNADYKQNSLEDTLLNTGKSAICNDIENELNSPYWQQYAARSDVRSLMVLPIKKAETIIGILNLYASETPFFDEQEITLLEEAADDISFALDVFEKDQHRKLMEDRVMHNELRLNQAQAIAHFGNWDLDLSTGISEWSDEFCRIYGLENCDNIHSSESWEAFIHPEDTEHVKLLTEQGKDTLSNFSYHHRILRKDKSVRHIYSQVQFEFDKDGIPVGMHGVAHDITEMKEAEDKLSKVVADIVQRNKDLEQFSYIVSHNLRAPVANILGLIGVIQIIDQDQEERTMATDYLSVAAKNLDSVIMDINSILELKHKVNAKWEQVLFIDLINDIQNSLGAAIHGEKASIICDFSAVTGMVTVKSYLHSIFYNLISNSIKYRRQGIAPVISISSLILNDKIRITFADNGLGIDLKKNGDYLFGLYKRFHNHVEGKGMGLYMVKTQVESLGGTVIVSSKVNAGTQFRIEFDLN